MPANLFEIEWSGPGRLATMAHPRGGEFLADEMSGLAQAGVQVLVSALYPDECQRTGLVAEPAAAVAAGLDFVSFPIADLGVPDPDRMPAAGRLADQLADQVRGGRFVVTHCWAGIGRSSMLAGATLVRLGLAPDEAWRRIRVARGLPVPDYPHQERWLYDFAAVQPHVG